MNDERRSALVCAGCLILRSIENPLLEMAGQLKVEEHISLADEFALAASKVIGAWVISSDHHGFDPIAVKGEIVFEWIR